MWYFILILSSLLLVSPVLAKDKDKSHSPRASSNPDYRPPYSGKKLYMDKTRGEKVYGDYNSYYWPYRYKSPSYEKKGEKNENVD